MLISGSAVWMKERWQLDTDIFLFEDRSIDEVFLGRLRNSFEKVILVKKNVKI